MQVMGIFMDSGVDQKIIIFKVFIMQHNRPLFRFIQAVYLAALFTRENYRKILIARLDLKQKSFNLVGVHGPILQ